jgi:NADH-quinone oxidoreductase subunit E
MSLAEKYPREIEAIYAKYPPDRKRSAVMPLLYLVQRDEGYITKDSMAEIAALLDLEMTEVASIIGFYSLYHDKKEGKYRMQVCNDLPCALRGADQFLDSLCQNLGIKVGETTPDGLITLEAVTCLAACDKAPMFQLQESDQLAYHENMTMDKTMELIDALKKGGLGESFRDARNMEVK